MSEYLPLLAIDTAAQQCAVALLTGGGAYERIEPRPQGQSELVIPMIEALLHKAGMDFAALRALAVTTGPGGFTGVRVGLAAAHGLALGLGIPAVGIDSFAAFGASIPLPHGGGRETYGAAVSRTGEGVSQPQSPPQPTPSPAILSHSAKDSAPPMREREIAIIIESRRAELYWQLMTPGGDPLTAPTCDTPAAIAAALRDAPVLLCGDGSRHLAALMPHCPIVDQTPGPSPLAIARLGLKRLGEGRPTGLPAALYVRPPDAKAPQNG